MNKVCGNCAHFVYDAANPRRGRCALCAERVNRAQLCFFGDDPTGFAPASAKALQDRSAALSKARYLATEMDL